MRLVLRTAICGGLALGLGACDLYGPRLLNPHQVENVYLMPRIDRQRVARDNCLSAYITQNDKFEYRIEDTVRNANAACVAEDDKLINLLLEMDTDSRPGITAAVRKESAFQAYRIALKVRAEPPPQKPAEPRPTPTISWR